SRERTINVAKALTVQLHATEEAIDTALSEAAHLIDTYISSRRAIRMSTIIAGDVHENTLKAMLALNAAQQHMTAAHKSLSKVQTQLRLEPNAITAPYDKPDPDDPGNGGVTDRPAPAHDHLEIL
ncbi:MAG: hypothetical protein JF615_13985, partial [Asticcacaulis sp.]|nr:hypothetical protein [Asticcacaulis sp.]